MAALIRTTRCNTGKHVLPCAISERICTQMSCAMFCGYVIKHYVIHVIDLHLLGFLHRHWGSQCPVKLFVGLHEVRGQPRFETRSLYHFMFKGEGGVVHEKMASAHFMCVTLLGNPYVNKQLICFRFKKNIRYSTTEYNLLSHLLFYTNVFYIFGLSHCEKPVYY